MPTSSCFFYENYLLTPCYNRDVNKHIDFYIIFKFVHGTCIAFIRNITI